MRALMAIAFVCCVASAASEPSPPRSTGSASQQQGKASEARHGVKRAASTPKTPEAIAQASPTTLQEVATIDKAEKHHSYASGEWWLVYLTGGLVLVTGALAWYTARLYRATVALGREARATSQQQATDMGNSIKEATRAATAMEGVAKATRDNATLMEGVMHRQMRAYISADLGGATYQDGKLRFAGHPSLDNTGLTPARKVSYWAMADILSTELSLEYKFPQGEARVTDVGMSPRQKYVINGVVDRFYPENEVVEIMKGNNRKLHVWGAVKYEDIFGESWETKFCHSYVFVNMGDGKWRPEGSYHPVHNHAT